MGLRSCRRSGEPANPVRHTALDSAGSAFARPRVVAGPRTMRQQGFLHHHQSRVNVSPERRRDDSRYATVHRPIGPRRHASRHLDTQGFFASGLLGDGSAMRLLLASFEDEIFHGCCRVDSLALLRLVACRPEGLADAVQPGNDSFHRSHKGGVCLLDRGKDTREPRLWRSSVFFFRRLLLCR